MSIVRHIYKLENIIGKTRFLLEFFINSNQLSGKHVFFQLKYVNF